jgi:chemotaxis protein methyltransferase CheR
MSTNTAQLATGYSQPLPEMTAGSVNISDREFHLLSTLVYEKFGINLTQEKRALLVGRLGKLLRSGGFKDFKAYYDYLLADATGSALDSLINRISTNYTFFYRESEHFDFFSSVVLPELDGRMRREKYRDLRLWCAGCSSGQEPYILAMLLLEYFGKEYGGWKAGLLATDISAKALEIATRGIYPEEALDRLPASLKRRYFKKAGQQEYEVKGRVKNEITFRRFNLMNERFPFRKPFHVIFCRNVMIYFDQPTRDGLIRRFYENMVPEGYLFIGHSETLGRKQTLFEYVRPALYRRR